LSAVVLLVTSFPDYEADKKSGRRTLVILSGKQNSVKIVTSLIIVTCGMIIGGAIFDVIPVLSTIGLLSIPFAVKAIYSLKRFNESSQLISSMANSIIYSRVCGLLLAISFII
jgi:1,4-dihydroxy-2-naphthoate octaprenyltransferase